jgi:hypothetical protein
MLRCIVYSIFLFLPGFLLAQGSAGSVASLETRSIVDMPTAGVLARGTYAVNVYAFTGNSVMVEWSAGILTNLNAGISFGGGNIIGTGEPTWQDLPGFHIRFRLIDETLRFPAVTLGASTQGRGVYFSGNREFQVQSPGVFAAVSKSFRWLGTMALHGGINYSFEPDAENRSINAYAGMEKSIGGPCSLHLEYNAGLSGEKTALLETGGLLNAALRCSLGRGFTIELQAQDLLLHYRDAERITRTLAIEYIGWF